MLTLVSCKSLRSSVGARRARPSEISEFKLNAKLIRHYVPKITSRRAIEWSIVRLELLHILWLQLSLVFSTKTHISEHFARLPNKRGEREKGKVTMHCLTVLFATAVLLVAVSHGKSIDRCDFVHELKRFRPQIEYNELNAWTCIAQYQSNFNTSLLNSDTTGAVYHGIFQISDVYWCSSTVNNDRACRIHCDQLHDTYLKDDFGCIEKVYAEHLRIHGNGFSAWPIHQQYCSDGRDLIKDCFAGKGIDKHLQQKDKFKSIAEKKAHKIYERCELARELYYKHNVPFEQVATWVCIAKYESNFNTSAVGHLNSDGSLDHGLFQISDIYWCSPPGKGWVCGLSCAKLENSDISDDVTCMMRIYNEHHR